MEQISTTGVAMFTLPVRRLEKSEKWYRDVLGFETTLKISEPRWCEMTLADKSIRVGLAEVQDLVLGQTAMTFSVVDIQEAQKKLHKSNIDCSTISEVTGVAKIITFEDPDGNRLMLRQELQE